MSGIYTSTIHNNRNMLIRSITPIQYIELVLETHRHSQHDYNYYNVGPVPITLNTKMLSTLFFNAIKI